MEFLKGQKDEIAKEFTEIEEQKSKTLAGVQEAMAALEESKLRLPALKAKLIEQGERKRQEIIEQAREQSRLVMNGARHKIGYQILNAREELSMELLDMAMEEALKALPRIITPEDNQRQIEKYLTAAR
jgi:F-type H+-transporting ATPase subunit b